MDDEDDHPLSWLTSHVPRKVLLVYAALGLGVAALAAWEQVTGGGMSAILLVFFAPVVAIGIGSGIVSHVRALRAPTRRPFKLRAGWLEFFAATGSLLVLGVFSLVDNDPRTNAAIGSVMLAVGLALIVTFLRYLAKPVRDDDNA